MSLDKQGSYQGMPFRHAVEWLNYDWLAAAGHSG